MSNFRWVKIGELIELCEERNSNNKLGVDRVMGMTLEKEIIPTKAKLDGGDLSKFYVVKPFEFVYNPRTHGKKIGLGLNETGEDFLISWNNTAFRVKDESIVLPQYLYMNFSRSEWDREACFNSWGSSTEVFSWSEFCRMKILLPSIEVQRLVVESWVSLRNVKAQNEALANPIMQLCQSYVQECKYRYEYKELRPFIRRHDVKNSNNAIKVVKSVSVSKTFNDTNAKVDKSNLSGYKVVLPRQISYVQTTSNEKCLAAALSTFDYPIVVTSVNEVFSTDEAFLLPEFLHLYFLRKEVDRYARFHSWGSARETFDWEDMQRMEIPLPPVEVQRAIVSLYQCALEYKAIAAEADAQARSICSALMQHAINS